MALTKQQHAERRTGIGGSDAGIIMGVNPWMDRLSLYYEKRGEREMLPAKPESTKQGRAWGSRLEQVVADFYVEKTGRKVIRQNKVIRHKKLDWMIVHMDRMVLKTGVRRGLECKTARAGEDWSELPPYVLFQCLHTMEVASLEVMDVCVLIGGRDAEIIEVHPDRDLIRDMMAEEEAFWDRVQTGTPPAPQWDHRSTDKLLQKLYPGTTGEVLEADDELTKMVEDWESYKQASKEFDERSKAAKRHVLGIMGEASALALPDGTYITRKEVRRSGYVREVTAGTYIDVRHVKALRLPT